MTVYVDDAEMPWRGGEWCHMQADSLDELHAFATKIGLKREWFQPGSRPETAHYDVTMSKRAQALRLGAVAETTREGAGRRKRLTSARQALLASEKSVDV